MGGLSAQHSEDRVALAHPRLQRNGASPRKVRVDLAWQCEGDPHCFAAAQNMDLTVSQGRATAHLFHLGVVHAISGCACPMMLEEMTNLLVAHRLLSEAWVAVCDRLRCRAIGCTQAIECQLKDTF